MITVWVLVITMSGYRENSVMAIDNIATYSQCAILADRINKASPHHVGTMCFSVAKAKP